MEEVIGFQWFCLISKTPNILQKWSKSRIIHIQHLKNILYSFSIAYDRDHYGIRNFASDPPVHTHSVKYVIKEEENRKKQLFVRSIENESLAFDWGLLLIALRFTPLHSAVPISIHFIFSFRKKLIFLLVFAEYINARTSTAPSKPSFYACP